MDISELAAQVKSYKHRLQGVESTRVFLYGELTKEIPSVVEQIKEDLPQGYSIDIAQSKICVMNKGGEGWASESLVGELWMDLRAAYEGKVLSAGGEHFTELGQLQHSLEEKLDCIAQQYNVDKIAIMPESIQ